MELNEETNSAHILVIDDNDDALELFTYRFREWFKIDTAEGAREGLDKLGANKFDVVITDYEMPGINGIELLKKVKEKHPDLPVIFYTGQGNEDVAREAFILGASDYFTKELRGFIHTEKIKNSIEKAIEIRKVEREKRKTEEKYRNLVELSPDPIVILQDTRFVFVNSAFINLFGFTHREVKNGLSAFQLAPPDNVDDMKRRVGDFLASEELPGNYGMVLLGKDGRKIDCEISVTRIDYREKPAALLIIRDVTERKKEELRIRTYREQLSLLGANGLSKKEKSGESSTSPDDDNPHLVDGKYTIKDLIDVDYLRQVMDKFSQATGFTTGFVSYPDQEILFGTGWRDICTKFHRINSQSVMSCKKSNMELSQGLRQLKQINISHCENGLVDGATPIIVKGKFIAYLATGQLMFKQPDLDFFQKQAEKFGYDVNAYMKALQEVPVVEEERMKRVLIFLGEMATLVAELGLMNLRARENAMLLAEEIARCKEIEERLKLVATINSKLI